jgi:hypothetical protein
MWDRNIHWCIDHDVREGLCDGNGMQGMAVSDGVVDAAYELSRVIEQFSATLAVARMGGNHRRVRSLSRKKLVVLTDLAPLTLGVHHGRSAPPTLQ